MKRNLNKKILFILGFLMFFILINCKKSYAATTVFFTEDNSVISSYNNEWVESYLDLNMNLGTGIKEILIDKHQDYFTFTSDEIGDYWSCEKLPLDDGTYYYLVLFCPGQIALRNHYSNFCEYHFNSNGIEKTKCFSILFSANGFYADSSCYDCSSDINTGLAMFPQNFSAVFDCAYYSHSFIVSNCDILDCSNGAQEGAILFTEPVTKNSTTLAPVIQREKTKGTLQVTLKEIILILPLIIVVVVSLVGLRKALKMLFQLLRRS